MDMLNAQPASPRKWHQIWLDVWIHPGVDTFRRALQEPEVKVSRAFIWVTVTSFIGYLAYWLIYQIFYPQAMIYSNIRGSTYWLCLTIASPIIAVVGISISSAVYRWIASLLGGQGAWDKLVYCFSVVAAPFTFITILLSALMLMLGSIIPGLTICGSLITLPISIYAIALNVMALDAVEGFGTGKALLTFFIPVIIIIMLGICIGLFVTIAAVQTQY